VTVRHPRSWAAIVVCQGEQASKAISDNDFGARNGVSHGMSPSKRSKGQTRLVGPRFLAHRGLGFRGSRFRWLSLLRSRGRYNNVRYALWGNSRTIRCVRRRRLPSAGWAPRAFESPSVPFLLQFSSYADLDASSPA
jgi:hypothetical protein